MIQVSALEKKKGHMEAANIHSYKNNQNWYTRVTYLWWTRAFSIYMNWTDVVAEQTHGRQQETSFLTSWKHLNKTKVTDDMASCIVKIFSQLKSNKNRKVRRQVGFSLVYNIF